MNFTSLEFALFLPLVFALYWIIGCARRSMQNGLLLVASYLFYGWWDWRFLILIFISSLTDYLIGFAIFTSTSQKKRKRYLWVSILFNLSLLGFFKYFNFFLESFVHAFTFLGVPIGPSISLSILLPVGISFYTFQSMSYTIDIYYRKMLPTHNIWDFLAFVSFFPQLVAGPIERASHLLPQFTEHRTWHAEYTIGGLRQILWGLLKKMVIADNAALYANEIFSNHASLDSSTLFLGACFFAFQIYGDFSGYSDIARGTAKLFGFSLNKNFDYPYFALTIQDFWKRWHISLTTWFRDYVYIPLGGSYQGKPTTIRNTFVVFLLSGLWHGANWTFILWGFCHALLFMPTILRKGKRIDNKRLVRLTPLTTIQRYTSLLLTFLSVTLLWIFFRSSNLNEACTYYYRLATCFTSIVPVILPKKFLLILILFILTEWFTRSREHALDFSTQQLPSRWMRWSIYYLILLIIWQFHAPAQQFIYFQF